MHHSVSQGKNLLHPPRNMGLVTPLSLRQIKHFYSNICNFVFKQNVLLFGHVTNIARQIFLVCVMQKVFLKLFKHSAEQIICIKQCSNAWAKIKHCLSSTWNLLFKQNVLPFGHVENIASQIFLFEWSRECFWSSLKTLRRNSVYQAMFCDGAKQSHTFLSNICNCMLKQNVLSLSHVTNIAGQIFFVGMKQKMF